MGTWEVTRSAYVQHSPDLGTEPHGQLIVELMCQLQEANISLEAEERVLDVVREIRRDMHDMRKMPGDFLGIVKDGVVIKSKSW